MNIGDNLFEEWCRRSIDQPSGGTYAIAAALVMMSSAINRLGNADADTPMGAIELLGKTIRDSLDDVAAAIEGYRRAPDDE